MSEETKTNPTTPDGTGESTPAAEKTFTQEDVNAIVARESKSAVEKLLKETGIAPEGDYKAVLKTFKDWQDSQKSDLKKATGALTVAEQAKANAEAKAMALERKFTAISKGIPADKDNDKTDKYIRLAEAYMSEDIDFDAALDLAIKDFPIIDSGVGGSGGNPAQTPDVKTEEKTYLDKKYKDNPYYKK